MLLISSGDALVYIPELMDAISFQVPCQRGQAQVLYKGREASRVHAEISMPDGQTGPWFMLRSAGRPPSIDAASESIT